MAAIPQTYTLCGKVKSGLYHFMIQTTFAFYNGPPGDSCALMLDRGWVHHGPPRRSHSIGELSTENNITSEPAILRLHPSRQRTHHKSNHKFFAIQLTRSPGYSTPLTHIWHRQFAQCHILFAAIQHRVSPGRCHTDPAAA